MKKSRNLENTFIQAISLTIIFVITIVILSYSYFEYKKSSKLYKENLNKFIENISHVYTTFLWEIDTDNLNKFSNILLYSNKDLCKITIEDEFKKKVFEKRKDEPYCNDASIKILKKLYYKNKYLGKIEFLFSNSYIKESFYKLLLLGLLISLIISFLVIVLIKFIFSKFIYTPIKNITNNLELIAAGDYNVNFEKLNVKEFDEIVSNLNDMILNIRIRRKKIVELTEKLNILINEIPEGVIILDEDANYVEVNDSFCKMLKMDKEELMTKKIDDVSAEGYSLRRAMDNFDKIKEYGYYEFEWVLKNKEGKEIPVLIKGKKIKIGDSYYILTTFIDITYMKNLEKEIVKREKLESLGILAGGIAHDFNNILTAIIGNIELLQIWFEKKEYEKVKEKLKNIFDSVERAKSLTHQLLTFSKGGVPVKKEFFNLKDLIIDTVNFILSGTAINVKFDFDKNLKPVKIDPDQISLVIENIILNSKDALGNSGEIIIKCVNFLDFVKISIRDNGHGIPPEIIGKIWDPYFTTKEKGTGLGLSIVYSIIKKHNGEIKVYSELDKYTEFQIFLPVADSVDKEIVISKSKSTSKHQIQKGLKVLVMDDEENILEVLKDMFEFLQCEAKFVKNGEEAIEMFKKENFDVVMLDLTIRGGMGGKECIQKLKEIDKNVKAIVYSGYSHDPILKDFRKYGFCAALKKPFKLNELKEAIEYCFHS